MEVAPPAPADSAGGGGPGAATNAETSVGVASAEAPEAETPEEPVGKAVGSSEGPSRTLHLLQAEDQQQNLKQLWAREEGTKAVFLDYDGTLREFEARPELAVPSQELQRLLAALNERADIVTHIVSGRDAKFLKAHFSVYRRIALIAEHERRVAGRFQILRPDTQDWRPRPTVSRDHEDWKQALRPEMKKCVDLTTGSHLEEKASALVWHYREVEDEVLGEATAVTLAKEIERLTAEQQIRDISVSIGHKIVEVSSRSVTKGALMQSICEDRRKAGEPFRAGLVAGDDVSDESMFEMAPSEFLTIKVGQTATSARFRVDSPEQLRAFLWRLIS